MIDHEEAPPIKMYKTKLQELCHKRRWGLPKYSIMKDGPDHIPSFKASLSLNGLTFDSLEPSTSSKHAQNLAAKNAFLYFSSSYSSSPPLPPSQLTAGSSTPTAETDTKEQIIGAARPQDTPIPADSSVMMHDFDHLYKSRLQNYAQRRNLDLPIFTNKTEGPPHAPCFKATVLVDGQSFESPTFFSSLKEAEQAAAKVALISLSLDSFQKGDSGVYRNLLQELAQKEGFCTPTYKTIKSGTVHMPTFFSIVEVEGKEFPGKAGKSKKQAEQNAAKVAYITLKDRGFNKDAASYYSDSVENEAEESIYISDDINSSQDLKQEASSPLALAKKEEPDLDEILPSIVKVSNVSLSSSEAVSESSPKRCPSSPVPSQIDLSTLSISESNKAMTAETNSYLLCNRFRVYTSFPDISFPEGTTVLPIRENRWVAVSLEFPNEDI